MDKVYASMITPTLGLDVLAWSCDKAMSVLSSPTSSYESRNSAKITLVEIHPVRPWILSCDKEGEVFLWDYLANRLLFRKTVHDILKNGGKENVNLSFESSQKSRSRLILKADYRLASNLVIDTLKRDVSNPSLPSLFNRHCPSHSIQENMHRMKSKGYIPSPLSRQMFTSSRKSHYVSRSKRRISVSDNQLRYIPPLTVQPPINTVRQIIFADRLAVSYSSGIAIDAAEDCFNSDSRLMFVCDTVILFYDFSIDTVVSIAGRKDTL